MKKQIVITFCVIFVLMGSLTRGKALKSGQAAIFLNDGSKVIGEIIDISSRRMVLELKDQPNIKLSRIWMINFMNTDWYFPKERSQIKPAKHNLFLKGGGMTRGIIIDFSSRQRVFELDTGKKIKIGSVERIYFSKNTPEKFKKPKKVKKPVKVKKPIKIKKDTEN